MTAPRLIMMVSLGLTLLFAPLAVEAQPAGTVPRIGLLDSGSFAARASLWEAFRQGMRQLGYVEGQTVVFEARGADGKNERLPALAAELVRLKPDVIVTASNFAAQAAHQATATIPIVTASGDPLAIGLVTNLARPGGNVTGVTSQTVELSAKRLDLARELVPGASRLGILGTGSSIIRETETAARALGIRLDVVGVRSPAELDGAFSTIARRRPGVLIVAPSSAFFGERRRVAELAVKHRLPTVHASQEYAEAGGLIAYGTDLAALFRRAAVYVDKILKGAKPGDLPIEQPTKFELVINLKTAKALGLTIPPSVLARADEIIE
ncbi:MAG TPA: ABC transporter substrate-binding protein [Methylomirabilota bacterium]|jgi:putative ABC transport system substrate-binding protein|nr:ABC transporter substrate-binding protein [Methylomirabilota bacterium]